MVEAHTLGPIKGPRTIRLRRLVVAHLLADLAERLLLELANALARQVVLVANLLQRELVLVVEAEAPADDPRLVSVVSRRRTSSLHLRLAR